MKLKEVKCQKCNKTVHKDKLKRHIEYCEYEEIKDDQLPIPATPKKATVCDEGSKKK